MTPEHGHLLVVDDNEMNRDMLSRRLQRQGHTVAVGAHGHQALEMAEKHKFDLILLDIMMPEISGLEVLKRLRENYSVADLPVIMVTAKDQSEDIVEALKLGANDYVTKPIDFPVVNARVQTQLSLKRLSQLKDEFLSIASHDLKNPLTSIIGYASFFAQTLAPGDAVTKEVHECIAKIANLAQVMQRIIEDFLDLQAIKDGQLKLELAPVDVNQIARLVQGNNVAYAKGKEINLSLELRDELPQIRADVARIQQVVDNLVNNAIKFSGKGGRVIIRTRADQQAVVVEVSDSGPGLTEEDMQKLFVKYARLSSKPTGAEKSSRLGLAICKKVIDLHGGQIGARNNPGGGATFWVRLPVGAT